VTAGLQSLSPTYVSQVPDDADMEALRASDKLVTSSSRRNRRSASR